MAGSWFQVALLGQGALFGLTADAHAVGPRLVASALGAVVCLAAIAVGRRRPSLFRPGPCSCAAVALGALAWPLTALGGAAGFVAGYLACQCASLWALVMTFGALGTLGADIRRVPLLAGGIVASGLVAACMLLLGARGEALLGCAVACDVAAILLSWPLGARRLAGVAAGTPHVELEIAQPESFLPYSDRLFLGLLLLGCAAGCTTSVLADAEAPAGMLAGGTALFALLGVALLAAGLRGEAGGPAGDDGPVGASAFARAFARRSAGAPSPAAPDVDPSLSGRAEALVGTSYKAAVTLLVVGLLVGLVWTPEGVVLPVVGGACRIAGSLAFFLVLYEIVDALAGRSEAELFSLAAFAGLSSCLGSLADVLLWALADAAYAGGSARHNTLMALFFLAFVLVNYLLLSRADLADSLRGVRPARPPVAPARPSSGMMSDERIREVARAHGLTARESDVFVLLARGHGGHAIEERLCVSHNTVKSHTRSVYAKLEVHSQQELIDLAERETR